MLKFKKTVSIISMVALSASLVSFAGCQGNQRPLEPVPEPAKTETPALEGYNLLWSDEFDGNALDMKFVNTTDKNLVVYITDVGGTLTAAIYQVN